MTPAELTATELHTLHDEALDNLDAAIRMEGATGRRAESMSRAYWEGYSEAVAHIIRMEEGRE